MPGSARARHYRRGESRRLDRGVAPPTMTTPRRVLHGRGAPRLRIASRLVLLPRADHVGIMGPPSSRGRHRSGGRPMSHPARRLSPTGWDVPSDAPPVEPCPVFARPWHRALLALFAASWVVALGLPALFPDSEMLVTTLLASTGIGSASGLGLASWAVASAL